jgi:hypothetical protein
VDGLPSVQDGLPSVQDGLPSVQDGLPSVQDGLPSVQDGLPSVLDGPDWVPTACPDCPRPSMVRGGSGRSAQGPGRSGWFWTVCPGSSTTRISQLLGILQPVQTLPLDLGLQLGWTLQLQLIMQILQLS